MDHVSTGVGLLIFVLFVVPGFTAIERFHERVPTKTLSVFDKSVYSLIYSVFVHVFLLAYLCIAINVYTGAPLRRALHDFLFLGLVSDSVAELYRFCVQVWQGEVAAIYLVWPVALYCLLSIACGRGLAWLVWKSAILTGGSEKWQGVWHRAFSDEMVKPVRVRLKGGRTYIGYMELDSNDYETIAGAEKDFVITQPQLDTEEGWKDLTEYGATRALFNTREVEAIEFDYLPAPYRGPGLTARVFCWLRATRMVRCLSSTWLVCRLAGYLIWRCFKR